MADRLKDQFFTHESLTRLAAAIQAVYPAFDAAHFLALIYHERWEGRELKDRMRHTAWCLGQTLPADYAEALAILTQVAPQVDGFEALTLPDFVERYGQDYWDLSLPALAFFTQYGSAEFAIRPFLHQDPERALAYLRRWATDPNPHVRRLASEGCRPRLPWGMALPRFKADPHPILPILEALKDDESESVRRSVANNLNDIAKDHPDLALDIATRWYGHSERTDALVKHACRGLLKAGDRRAMALFGFDEPGHIEVRGLRVETPTVSIGADLVFAFELQVGGTAETQVRLEYAVHYMKKRGATAAKVFKHSEKVYAPGVYAVRKRHSMADRTTRTHHPGPHEVAIIVNGQEQARAPFEVVASA